MARTFAPIVAVQPTSQPIKIEYFVQTTAARTDMHPVYQRDIRWTQEHMCELISTIMHSGIIPGIMLYKFQSEDARQMPQHKYECIDGQHRIFAISHFKNGKPVTEIPGKDFLVFLPYKDEAGLLTHIFYKENEHTQRWAAANPGKRVEYMTEE